MRTFVIGLLLAGSTLTGIASAEPPPGGPAGAKCAFNSSTDITGPPGWQVGHIRGGPLVTGEDGTLVCEIHVNNNSHDGPAVVSESFEAVGGVVTAGPPRVLRYPATAADTVSLCTEWHGANGTLYWESMAGRRLGAWSPTPTTCNSPYMDEPGELECSVWLAVDQRAGTNLAEVWQDCESYEPIV